MNDVGELNDRIQETSVAIAHHERSLAVHPTPSLEASLHSLQKRMQKLQAELAALDPNGTEVRDTSENGNAHHVTTASPAAELPARDS